MKARVKGDIYSICLIALFTALIAVGAFITIPLPYAPFTLQFLFTALAGLLLGSKRGLISVLVYIFIGLIGIPVFTKGGGFSYVLQPTFGYLVGFAAGTFLEGLIVERGNSITFGRSLAACFVNLVMTYAIGMVYFYIIGNYVIDSPIGVWALILNCCLVFIPGDAASCFVCAACAKRVMPVVKRGFSYGR